MSKTNTAQELSNKWNAAESMTFSQACFNFTRTMTDCSNWLEAFAEGNPTMRERLVAASKAAKQATRDLELTINRKD